MNNRTKGKTAGVLLAGGRSIRFKGLKQIAQYQGSPLILHALEAALHSDLDPVILVLGFGVEQILPFLASNKNHPKLEIVTHCEFDQGQSASIRYGLSKLSPECPSVLFVLADQPLLTSKIINRIIKEYQTSSKKIAVPFTQGKPCGPGLFDFDYFEDLKSLTGDQGGKNLIKMHSDDVLKIDFADPSPFRDIDTTEDLRGIQKKI